MQNHTTPLKELIELTEIGVDNGRPPSLSNFPPKFAPRGLSVWRQVVKELPETGSIAEHWKFAVELYIKRCNAKGIFPWKVSAEQSKTDVAVYLLSSARRQLRVFFKKIELFKKVRIFSTSRSYIFKKDSFEVEITANLYPIKDPKFQDWLRNKVRFRGNGRVKEFWLRLYSCQDSEVKIRFELVNPLHPKLIVNIKFGSPILLPYYDKPLTKEYLLRYVDEHIWMPIVRSNRFENAGWRLF